MIKIKLKDFEGPLDLLLQLIEKEKLSITEVTLGEVTEQYIDLLRKIPQSEEELADFLVIASKLLFIKSKILLPRIDFVSPEESTSLVAQLRLYKIFRDASLDIQKILRRKIFGYSRDRLYNVEVSFSPPPGLTLEKLEKAMMAVLDEIEPIFRLPQERKERVISIDERISAILEAIKKQANLEFSHLIKKSKNKMELIVNFLALLELIKRQLISVYQRESFGEIILRKIS